MTLYLRQISLSFHDIEDETDYLEITEEVIEEKEKRAKKIIGSYLLEKGITDIRELENRDELILRLIKETQLSYRKVAGLTNTTLSCLQKTNKKYRP